MGIFITNTAALCLFTVFNRFFIVYGIMVLHPLIIAATYNFETMGKYAHRCRIQVGCNIRATLDSITLRPQSKHYMSYP